MLSPGLWARAGRRPALPAPGEALSAPARCLLPKEGVRRTPLNRSPARTGAHALHDAAPVVTIFYCVTCNYLPQATGAADALREALGIEAVLVRGHSGRFEVEVDGKPKQFSPPEVSAMILAKLKADAADYIDALEIK